MGELERRNLLAWLKAPATRQATVEQFIVSGFISGPAFDLPAGPVMFAVGGEYRDESSDNRGDALTATGQNASNKSPDSVGQFDVSEGFIELDIPVLSGLALADSLDVNLAARFSDYSTVGSTQAYAASFDWVVNDYVRARGQLSRAVRAPNISELFAPLGQTFPNVVDPCRDVSAGSTGTFDAACRQDPDVAARIARDGSLNLSQSELQGVSGFNGGALSGGFELEAETSDSYSVGLMFSPAFVPALEPLSISVDYFNIKIEDAISTIGRQTALNECYSADGGYDANSNFCSLIQRWNTGSFLGALQFVNSYSQNVATTETSGIDVQASYLFDFNDIFSNMSTDIGTLNVSVVYAYLDKFDTVPFEGADVVDSKGTVGLPEHEAQIALVYNRGPLTLALDTQFIGESVFSNNENNAFFGPKIAPHAFTDLQARYDLGQTQLFFGVDNILDEYVPLGFSTPPTSTGWDTAPDVYDGLGRRFYGGVRHTF